MIKRTALGVLTLVVLTVLFLETAEGQTCEKYKNGTGFGFCDKWVDYEFYLPNAPTKWIG